MDEVGIVFDYYWERGHDHHFATTNTELFPYQLLNGGFQWYTPSDERWDVYTVNVERT